MRSFSAVEKVLGSALTYSGAKQLVPAANRPILFYCIDNIANAGIRDIVMVISPETGDEIRQTVGNGRAWNVQITLFRRTLLQVLPAR